MNGNKETSGRVSPPAPPTPPKTTPALQPTQPRSSSVDATAGLKLMSDMVDSSYKMFDGLGRLWQRDAGKPPSKAGITTSTDSTAAGRGRASTVTESELKDMPSNGNNSIRGALSPSSSSSTDGGGSTRTISRRPDALHALLQAPSQLIHSVGNARGQQSIDKAEGPMQKFLDKKSVEDLKIGEVAELLADYKRLAAMMKQAGLC